MPPEDCVVYVLTCVHCRAEIGATGYPVKGPPRALRNGSDVRRGHIALWCPHCMVATEYEEVAR